METEAEAEADVVDVADVVDATALSAALPTWSLGMSSLVMPEDFRRIGVEISASCHHCS
ncbi:hypothetical protein [Streptomyces sp. NPDC058240]|uniref:hypothetical protein n=1 Tax=Streptomyces sp. NPDC058240 TaxID=3346396 RepID=UPI0036F021F5